MTTCGSGKKAYATQAIAEDVLIELWSKFEYAPNQGPVAVYACEDCGLYHLTSRGPMNEKLAQQLADGRISRQREANKWLDKFK